MVLGMNENMEWNIEWLDRDPYPSMEVYYYENGELAYEIDKRVERLSRLPEIGLDPIAPNDRVPLGLIR
jgi:hypothetical protein